MRVRVGIILGMGAGLFVKASDTRMLKGMFGILNIVLLCMISACIVKDRNTLKRPIPLITTPKLGR